MVSERSLEIGRKIGDVKGEGNALIDLGSVYKTREGISRRWCIAAKMRRGGSNIFLIQNSLGQKVQR
jgi:hypothetical protein